MATHTICDFDSQPVTLIRRRRVNVFGHQVMVSIKIEDSEGKAEVDVCERCVAAALKVLLPEFLDTPAPLAAIIPKPTVQPESHEPQPRTKKQQMQRKGGE